MKIGGIKIQILDRLICIILPCLHSNDNLSQIVALGSACHVAEKDFEIGEYIIPKGSSVYASTRPIMYDEKVSWSVISGRDFSFHLWKGPGTWCRCDHE